MNIQFKNNAFSTLASAISAIDTGMSVAFGDGLLFPALTAGQYFYLTLQSQDNAYEIVKVTATSGDNFTITRAQEGTTAKAFTAGALAELRVTNQGLLDALAAVTIADGSITYAKIQNISATQRILARNSSGAGVTEEVTITQVLNWIGSTQGNVLYRGASSWSALAPGTSGQVLTSGGASANPSWTSIVGVTDGDKGDVVVSSTGATWTIDTAVVTYAKIQNISGQYKLLGRSSSGAGVTQEISSSLAVFTFLGSADAAAMRTNAGLGTISTQNASAVTITGGTVAGITSSQARVYHSPETSGTLTALSANGVVAMTGDVTLDGNIFTADDITLLYSGAASRTVTEGGSATMRMGGTTFTGNRAMAARTLATVYWVSATECVITGAGVT